MPKRAAEDSEIDDRGGNRRRLDPDLPQPAQTTSTLAIRIAPRTSLLGLPGELRNRIHRLVLLEDHRIEISPPILMPGLVRSCRQLRQEAMSIYRNENEFKIHVRHCKLEPAPEHWVWDGKDSNVFMDVQDIDSWPNLQEWLKQYHGLGSWGMPDYQSDHPSVLFVLCARLFDVVDTLRSVPWEVVEKTLEKLRETFYALEGSSVFAPES